MVIQLLRIRQGTESTLSGMLIDGAKLGYFLEDQDRGLTATMSLAEIAAKKVHSRTAIPTGRYRVAMTYSNRFKKVMPELLDVPGFAGIRIHAGNYIGNTDGCLLTGTTYDADTKGYLRVWESKKALAILQASINAAIGRKEEIWCTVGRAY